MKKNNFDSSQHIRQKKEFEKIFEKGFRLYGGFFVFRTIVIDQDKSQLAIIVPKRFGNAVYRNKMRRVIKELFRHQFFPCSVAILVSQNKVFPNEQVANFELKKAFALLSDPFLVQQLSVGENISVKHTQFSLKHLSIFSKCAFRLIYYYRKFLSKSLTPSCRFTPSCSVYAMEAFRVHGFWRGLSLTTLRLLKCHPFSHQSGFDPIPYRKKQKKKAP
ncbi:MAG: membrane protein insertion efficiency factor YidD, partial [Brevinema sp.]